MKFKQLFKYVLPAILVGIAVVVIVQSQAQAQVSPPSLLKKIGSNLLPTTASTTIGSSTVDGSFRNLNVSGCTGCGGGGSSSGVVGGTVTSTIKGSASSSYIANFNSKYQFPSPTDLASLGCMGNAGITDWVGCLHYIYTIALSSMEIDIGGYSYPNDAATTSFNIAEKYILIKGVAGNGTVLNSSYTGSGCALTFDISHGKANGWGIDGVEIIGPNSGSSYGTCWGGVNGAEGGGFHNSLITHFWRNILVGDNTYLWYFVQSTSNFNFTNNTGGGLIFVNGSTNTGETIKCLECLLADGQPAANAIEVQTSGETNVAFKDGSSDDAQAFINQYGGQGNNVLFDNWHAEDPAAWNGSIPAYDYFTMNSGNPYGNDTLSIINSTIQADAGTRPEGNIVDLNGHLVLSNDSINNNGSNGYGVFTNVVSLQTTSSTIYSSGITQNTNQYNGIAATYLYGTTPLAGGTQTYNVSSTFDGPVKILSNNLRDAFGNLYSTSTSGGLATTTPFTAGCLPLASPSLALTNSTLCQTNNVSTTILTATSTISFDNSGSSFQSAVTSSTISYTVSGTNRMLFVAIKGNTGTDNITGVTFNGVSMTLNGKVNTPGDRWFYLYSLANPASGTHNIVVSANTTTDIATSIASYAGVAQTTPEATATNTATATTTITTNISTISDNDWLITGTDSPSASTTVATGTGRALNSGLIVFDSSSSVGLAGNYNTKLTAPSNGGFGVVVAAIAPAPAVTSSTVTSNVAVSSQYYSAFFNNSTTTAATSTNINWNNSNVQNLALGTSTTLTFTNVQPGARYILSLLQDNTGSRTVNWPASVHWSGSTAPTLTTTANKLDIISFVCLGVNGTNCYGAANTNFSP